MRVSAAMRPYRVDLAAYMRTCDSNYWRLVQLVPSLRQGYGAQARPHGMVGEACETLVAATGQAAGLRKEKPYWELVLASSGNARHPMRVAINVLESFRYTTTLEVVMESGFPAWSPAPAMQVRMYHDAATAEPLSYQGQRRLPVRSDIPNGQMFHPDEKHQVNDFLAEWLELCIRSGASARTSDILYAD